MGDTIFCLSTGLLPATKCLSTPLSWKAEQQQLWKQQADWKVYVCAKYVQNTQFVLPSDTTALGSTCCHSASGAVVKLSCWTWAVLLGVFWLTLSLSPLLPSAQHGLKPEGFSSAPQVTQPLALMFVHVLVQTTPKDGSVLLSPTRSLPTAQPGHLPCRSPRIPHSRPGRGASAWGQAGDW